MTRKAGRHNRKRKPKCQAPAPLVSVRCLGPREREHFFLSPDPKRVRVCPACRLAQNAYGGRLVTEHGDR